MEEKRHNWNDYASKEAKLKTEKRKQLLEKKESISERIRNLTIAEIKSDLYPQLKQEQAEIIAQLATL